jgi:hypothetical protein
VPLGIYTIAYQLDEEEDICENDETDNFITWEDMPFEYSNAMFGFYTIGGDAPDFDNFNDAIDALIDRGISDSVVFYARPGMYYEQFTIPDIEGVSASKQITFTTDPSKSDTATITYTSNTDNYVINLENASYINIQNLKIISEGYTNYQSTYGNVIILSNSNNINIQNNRIIGSADPSYISSDNALIYANASTQIANISIYNNIIENGSYGIYLIGWGEGDDSNPGIEISNNQLQDFLCLRQILLNWHQVNYNSFEQLQLPYIAFQDKFQKQELSFLWHAL